MTGGLQQNGEYNTMGFVAYTRHFIRPVPRGMRSTGIVERVGNENFTRNVSRIA